MNILRPVPGKGSRLVHTFLRFSYFRNFFMHNILVPVLHLFIEADVPGIQDRPRSWCVYYSSRIYSSSKLRLNSSQCNSTIVRKSVRGICIQSKALHSFGACTYNQRNNDLRKVNFDTSCIRTT